MSISEEKKSIKKNRCIQLAAIAASLALGHASDISAANEYVPAKASFFSAEHCAYSVDCEINKELLGPAGGA